MKTVGFVSLGCSKNQVDSEVLLGLLRERGYTIVQDPSQAETIVVNTCGFILPAKEESIATIFEMAEYKETGKLKTLIVTGCLVQRYGEDLKNEIPEIDILMGVAEYSRIFEAIEQANAGHRPLFTGEGDRFFKSPRVLISPPYSAYVKISDGCDNKCTYCAIPLIRGAYHSRPYNEIVEECRDLVAKGVHEITLIAQDTSRYGNDFAEKTLLLPALLKEIHDIEGLHWLRVLYCYPDTVNKELLETMSSLPKVCAYLDLPLQHINARLLKAMNRRGTPEHIKQQIERCRQHGITIRTTMIVGFPGETDEEFEELMDFVRDTRFDRLGAFAYSPEEGTVAADMDDQIPEEVKQERLDRIMLLQQEISADICASRIGEVCEVLVEGRSHGRYYGRSRMEAPEIDGKIIFTSSKKLAPGEYVQVKITSSSEYDLIGEAVEE
ncbi:MAG: 30S ribosomal protein S12 methylthiotransferase RimO [Clostridia bacterium]|nr:30S ribosomal protein S12 methylthiotransferase RimO [Clostridia bacterium]